MLKLSLFEWLKIHFHRKNQVKKSRARAVYQPTVSGLIKFHIFIIVSTLYNNNCMIYDFAIKMSTVFVCWAIVCIVPCSLYRPQCSIVWLVFYPSSLFDLHCTLKLYTLNCTLKLSTLYCTLKLYTLHCTLKLYTLYLTLKLYTWHCTLKLYTLHCTL